MRFDAPHQLRHLHCRSAACSIRRADDPWRNPRCVGCSAIIWYNGSWEFMPEPGLPLGGHLDINAWSWFGGFQFMVDCKLSISSLGNDKQASKPFTTLHSRPLCQNNPRLQRKFSIWSNISFIHHGGSAISFLTLSTILMPGGGIGNWKTKFWWLQIFLWASFHVSIQVLTNF